MQSVGLIGGTGDLGTALAVHLAKGFQVNLGSRNKGKAIAAVNEIIAEKGETDFQKDLLLPVANEEAVENSEIVIATVPYENAVETVRNLANRFHAGQLLISTAASIKKNGNEFYSPMMEGGESITQQIRKLLPSTIEVACAFQTVPAKVLYREKKVASDVLVASDSKEAYEKTAAVIKSIDNLRPFYVGSLNLAGELERLTALLLNVAIKNHIKSPTLLISSF